MKENSSENRVEETLSSLDNIKRAAAPAGFYEKLQERMHSLDPGSSKWFHWLQAGVAAMLIMALVNGFMILQTEENDVAEVDDFKTEYFEPTASLLNY
ncbi:hypothetical protein [Marinoscillum sp. MHG1-6]|uniref:hypothetical protein n=1 Tax=Marinoscillum sp. MHG1-6 TaxID=2959627 RepID=UPI002157EA56|nr:hypothetical protein [Marinoscillum sp. MHG1-6]